MTADRFFPYAFDNRFLWIWGPLGARPNQDGVTLTGDGRFLATYGRFRVETPLSNISCAKKTGPYHWWRAIGVRLSLVDSGLTFGTTAAGGVCILFHEPVARLLFSGPGHAGLTVTVIDLDGLVMAVKPGNPSL